MIANSQTAQGFGNRLRAPMTYLFFVAQLGVLAIVIRQFELVSSAFLSVALLAFLGFMVHYLLPPRFRLPFFLLLSLIGIGVVVGPVPAAWLIGLGLCLIAVCHLPISFPARVVLLVAVAAVLAAMRADWLPAPWPNAIWPILGSMFMFRLIVYLYDIHYGNAPATFWHSLSYFFMLPNVCFPLFPVVDYQKFHNNYFDSDARRIYQVGIDWMVRGAIHLILYRVVYFYFTLAPSEVATPGDLLQFLLTTFLLYLKVSGQFHIVVGMLHLFGFNLSETNNLYLLASSFTDFWRRINIYWKDFMMKIFYYPVYFQLRRYGTFTAIIVSTLLVFLVTWFLHSYQWFWLRGTFPVTWQDGVYWTILAVLVAANSLYEIRFGRKRTLAQSAWNASGLIARLASTLGTLAIVVVLWSLWSTSTLAEWLGLWSALDPARLADAGTVPALLLVGLALGTPPRENQPQPGSLWARLPIERTTAGTVASLAVLFLIGIPAVYTQFGSGTANLVLSLRKDKLNRLDAVALERSYYENLIQVDRFNSALSDIYKNKPVEWLFVQSAGLMRFTDGFLQQELIPSIRVDTEFGRITTSRWGMRDQDYEKTAAPGTYRIAMLGASVEMGWGVGDGETFEALMEKKLNQDLGGRNFTRFEILNFGAPGYYPLQQAAALQRALEFAPGAVLYMAHGRELSRAAFYLADVTRKGVDVPYEPLRLIGQNAGLTVDMPESEALRRLAPHKPAILTWLYEEIARQCRNRDIIPVLIFLPQTEGGAWEEETPEALRIAAQAGFVVIDLMEVFEGHDPGSVELTEWDKHPNKLGHQIMADRIYQAVMQRPEISSAWRAEMPATPQAP